MVRGWGARSTEIRAMDARTGRRAKGIIDVGAGGRGGADAAARRKEHLEARLEKKLCSTTCGALDRDHGTR